MSCKFLELPSKFVSVIAKHFGRFDNSFNFYVVTCTKFGQISNVQYLSFHLAPILSSFMKIDVTLEMERKRQKT